MNKSNIILIGMPGAGKSTVGVLLAKALGMSFIDTDLIIQEREHKLLQAIIDQQGIAEFLSIEENVLGLLSATHSIIATGGSAVYSSQAMRHLKSIGDVIYLRLSYDEMAARLQNIATRGVVLKEGQRLRDLFEERAPLYEKYADIVIDCTDRSIEETVKIAVDHGPNLVKQ